jgi:hypothetical protein
VKHAFYIAFLIVLALAPFWLTAASVRGSSALSSEISYLNSVRVVSFYEPPVGYCAIGTCDGTDYKPMIDALVATGTQVVFYASPDMNSQGSFDQLPGLAQMVSYVKTRLPWVRLMGFLDGIDYCGPINSTIVSPGEYPGCHTLDITKPYYRQIVVDEADALIDAGFDYLMFDSVPWLPQFLPTVTQIQTIQAWKLMADAVKEYGRAKYGKEILVGMNNPDIEGSKELGAPYPYQDFIPVIIWKTKPSEFSASNIVDDWVGYKSRVLQIYGRMVPMMPFLDYGCYSTGCDTPLSVFGHLPKETQIKVLQELHDMAVRNGLLFAYPLYGGNILPQQQGHQSYDAIRQGTYDTIKQLTSSISPITTNPEWPIVKQVLTDLSQALDARLVSGRAKSIIDNASSTYDRMAEAFMNNDTQTVTQLALLIHRLISSAYDAEKAEGALVNAKYAIDTALREGRTKGLGTAREALAQADEAFNAWNYSEAARLAKEAQTLAEKASVPTFLDKLMMPLLTTPVGNTLLAAVALIITIAVVIVALPKIRHPAPKSEQ